MCLGKQILTLVLKDLSGHFLENSLEEVKGKAEEGAEEIIKSFSSPMR